MLIHYLRVARILIRAHRQGRLKSAGDRVQYAFRARWWDIDVFRHMNNARYLQYMEAARWGLTVRSGLFGLFVKRGWIFPISRIDIQYRRGISWRQGFEVSAEMLGTDDPKRAYVYQEFVCEGAVVASALVQFVMKDKKRTVSADEYLGVLGYPRPAPPVAGSEVARRVAGLAGKAAHEIKA